MTLDYRTLIAVEPRQIGATPSEPLSFTVTVSNDTRRFQRYSVTLAGLEDAQVTATPPLLDLGPGERGVVEVAATLPPFFPAGCHIAGIEVRSNDPGAPLLGFVEVEVDVQSVSSARLQMPESHLRGRLGGRGTLQLYNGGSQPLRFRFEGHNPENRLRFRFAPETVVLGPKSTTTVKLKVGTNPHPLGAPVRRAFDVVAQGPSGQLSVSGTFTNKAMVPTGFFKLLLAALVLLLGAILIQRAVHVFIVDTTSITWQRVTTGDTAVAPRAGHTSVWVEFPRPRIDQPVWRRTMTRIADWFSGRGRFDEGMISWGGIGDDGTLLATGALYRVRDGQWLLLPSFGAPSARTGHTAVWTGETMVVWGGHLASGDPLDPGAEYNPGTQRWSALPPGPLANRTGHTATWTGSEMIVFGGMTANGVVRTDGARLVPGELDPAHEDAVPGQVEAELRGGTWVTMAEFPGAPRHHHSATWTGTHLVVAGGYDPDGRALADAYVYDPSTDTWEDITRNPPAPGRACHIAVWTGTSVLLVAGTDQILFEDAVPCARLESLTVDPEAFLITPTPTDDGSRIVTVWSWERPEAQPPEHLGTDSVGLWTANELTIIQEVPSLDTLAAARYTPDQGTVNLPLPDPGVVANRTGFTGVWNTGSILVWGGLDQNDRVTNFGTLLVLPDR